MKRSTLSRLAAFAALVAACATLAPAHAADVDVGVSIRIGQPGVTGRIDIGHFPPARAVVVAPVVIERSVRRVRPAEPVYVWVPPGHRKAWRTHCREYRACGVPVVFVDHHGYAESMPSRGHHRHRDERRGRHDDDDRGRRGQGRDD
jgi:hypothetical protein